MSSGYGTHAFIIDHINKIPIPIPIQVVKIWSL